MACSSFTMSPTKVTQLVQLPLVHGYVVLEGWPPSAPKMSLRITWYCAWYDPWVSRRACAMTVFTSAWVPEPFWYPSAIHPPDT